MPTASISAMAAVQRQGGAARRWRWPSCLPERRRQDQRSQLARIPAEQARTASQLGRAKRSLPSRRAAQAMAYAAAEARSASARPAPSRMATRRASLASAAPCTPAPPSAARAASSTRACSRAARPSGPGLASERLRQRGQHAHLHGGRRREQPGDQAGRIRDGVPRDDRHLDAAQGHRALGLGAGAARHRHALPREEAHGGLPLLSVIGDHQQRARQRARRAASGLRRGGRRLGRRGAGPGSLELRQRHGRGQRPRAWAPGGCAARWSCACARLWLLGARLGLARPLRLRGELLALVEALDGAADGTLAGEHARARHSRCGTGAHPGAPGSAARAWRRYSSLPWSVSGTASKRSACSCGSRDSSGRGTGSALSWCSAMKGMPSCSLMAATTSSSVTRPSATSRSPSLPPSRRCRSSMLWSCVSEIFPADSSSSPSRRRTAGRGRSAASWVICAL